MTLPDTIALNDTALLNAMMKEGITIDDLLARGEYKFDSGAAYFKEASAPVAETPAPTKTKQTKASADSMQGGLF